jgi:hypothetical protein
MEGEVVKPTAAAMRSCALGGDKRLQCPTWWRRRKARAPGPQLRHDQGLLHTEHVVRGRLLSTELGTTRASRPPRGPGKSRLDPAFQLDASSDHARSILASSSMTAPSWSSAPSGGVCGITFNALRAAVLLRGSSTAVSAVGIRGPAAAAVTPAVAAVGGRGVLNEEKCKSRSRTSASTNPCCRRARGCQGGGA